MLQPLPSKKTPTALRTAATPCDSWGETTLGRSVVSDVSMSNMDSAEQNSHEGSSGWRALYVSAVGARAMTLRPADERSCSSYVSHAMRTISLSTAFRRRMPFDRSNVELVGVWWTTVLSFRRTSLSPDTAPSRVAKVHWSFMRMQLVIAEEKLSF